MSIFKDPFGASKLVKKSGCSCGKHASQGEHDTAAAREAATIAAAGEEQQFSRVVEAAVMRALFPDDIARRAFLKAVGTTTAAAALAQIFPIATATQVLAEGGVPEKKDLKVGFIPITCATPIIMAHPMGFYTKQGLTSKWSRRPAGRWCATRR